MDDRSESVGAAIIYILAVLGANLTATLFIPFPLFGTEGVWVSMGTLIFGFTFTQRDRMHRRGRRFVYGMIALAAVLTLVLLSSFKLIWGGPLIELFRGLEWTWLAESAEMLQASGWRVFAASALAIIVAESCDTEVYELFKEHSWLLRVFRSNAVSIPVDSIVFNVVAFGGHPLFPLGFLVKIILGEIAAKFVVGALAALFRPSNER